MVNIENTDVWKSDPSFRQIPSVFSIFTIGEYRCSKSRIFEIQVFDIHYRWTSKTRIYKSWRNKIRDIREILVFDLADKKRARGI